MKEGPTLRTSAGPPEPRRGRVCPCSSRPQPAHPEEDPRYSDLAAPGNQSVSLRPERENKGCVLVELFDACN